MRADAADALNTLSGWLGEVELAATLEPSYERRENLDLDRGEADDLDLVPVELEVEALFAPGDAFLAYFRSQLSREFVLRDEGADDAEPTSLLVNEAYVIVTEPKSGVSLQLGRQEFADDREWLYEAELDAVRLAHRGQRHLVELSASRKALLFDEDLLNPDEKDHSVNYILYASAEVLPDVFLGAFAVVRDNDREDSERHFFGVSSAGEILDGLEYWVNAAVLRGKEEDSRLRGYGFDLIGIYSFDAPLAPHVMLGYAFGSGDPDPDDDRDKSFQQTGLHDNDDELGGTASFHFYGETFDPELANMSILTAGIGMRPSEEFSLDVIYHAYRQDVASDELGDSALDAEPTGDSRRIGSEIDVVLGYEAREKLQVNGFLGWFRPGRAFGSGTDDAFFARLELEYGF